MRHCVGNRTEKGVARENLHHLVLTMGPRVTEPPPSAVAAASSSTTLHKHKPVELRVSSS